MNPYSPRTLQALENFHQGYNCCQSLVLAYCDLFGWDKETALKVSSSFGGGMGQLREICGTVSGMFMIAGLYNGTVTTDDPKAKKENYQLVQQLAARFKEKNQTLVCKELLQGLKYNTNGQAEERTLHYYQKRPCARFVEDAARCIEDILPIKF